MRPSEHSVYYLESIEVDPAQGCLRRENQETHLQQKPLQVLIYLLEHRGRLVTKEELIESVWDGTAVTDDALVQCVVDIRKALGDDPRNPRFIKTIARVGYRFVGPVEVRRSQTLATMETEEITSVKVQYEEETPDIFPAVSTVPAGLPALPAVQKPRLRVALGAVVVILPLSVIGLVLAWRHGSWPFAQRSIETRVALVSGKRPVLVMPFENQSSGPELEWMRDGLADMFIADLSRSPKLTVLSRQQLQVGLNRIGHEAANAVGIEEALKVAQKSHAEAFLMGSYAKFGNRLRIEVQIHDARNGQLLKDESLVVDRPEELLTQVDLLSLKLSTFWGAEPTQMEKSGLGDVMTDNLEAYRYYSLGMEKALGLRATDAVALFQKAVDRDPQFAMAYARIGYTYAVAQGYSDQAKPYLEKAFQLSGRLTDKDRLSIAGWYAIANRDYPGAIRQFREFISRYPLEVETYWQLGRLLEGEAQYDEAIAVLQQALVIDPEEPESYNKLGGFYSDIGRHKEGIAMRQHYVALSPREPNAHDSLGLSYQWAGLYQEAIEEYNKALALDPNFEIALVHLANVHFQMGHYREAIRLNQSFIGIAQSWRERARGYTNLAWIRWKQGNLDKAEQEAMEASRLGRGWVPDSVVLAAERGDLKRAEELSQHLSATDSPSAGRGSGLPLRLILYPRGYMALKEGHADQAIELFQETLRHVPTPWDIDSYESCLADAYLQLGRYDEAIAEYQRILRLNPNYPLAHYHLGLAYEGKGQSSQARAEFRHFLEVWKDADPDIPEVVAAKQRLAS